ncbi:MAG: DUF86 domain-containing protein [Phycisphaeraceae bacterium]|nr:DUF86 domain-containing protein [Phycisphaeraceae bacterium]
MPRKTDPLRDDRIRFEHMLLAAREALEFSDGKEEADIFADRLLARGLKDCLQEIGEAAARVSELGRARAPGIPWEKIVGMRHILVHV